MSQALISELPADPWSGTEAVPLVDVVRESGVPYENVRKVFRQGLVEPLPERGQFNAALLSHEDAVMLLRAAALALLAGIAIVTAVRVLRAPGITINLPGAA